MHRLAAFSPTLAHSHSFIFSRGETRSFMPGINTKSEQLVRSAVGGADFSERLTQRMLKHEHTETKLRIARECDPECTSVFSEGTSILGVCGLPTDSRWLVGLSDRPPLNRRQRACLRGKKRALPWSYLAEMPCAGKPPSDC